MELKNLNDYDITIKSLYEDEIKSYRNKTEFKQWQSVKHLRQKLQLERDFIPELKRFFEKQSREIKNKKPNVISIQDLLFKHYRAVFYKLTDRNIKQNTDDEIIKSILENAAKRQAGLIDDTTNIEIEKSLELAREELNKDGVIDPSLAVIYGIAARIFLNRIQGRIQGIAITETQLTYEMLRRELIDNAYEKLEEIIVIKDKKKLKELAKEADSFTIYKLSEEMEKPVVNNAVLFTIIALAMKEWATVGDAKVRGWHVEADGQTVPLSQPFIVMGELLQYPGDRAGSAKNICNCRCVCIYL